MPVYFLLISLPKYIVIPSDYPNPNAIRLYNSEKTIRKSIKARKRY